MLQPRIIPCLLIHKGGLVKTIQFKNHKYVGDPINAVRIFNEKKVDELIVLDIDASVNNVEPNYTLIEKLAKECRMPLCYGGGVKSLQQIKKILHLGVEKVALSSGAIKNLDLVGDAADQVGSQSVVAVLDVKKRKLSSRYDVYTHNGRKKSPISLEELLAELEDRGAGEVVINSIDRDGTMRGYDTNLSEKIKSSISIPLTMLGGAATYSDVSNLVKRFGIVGCALGSVFVFKGKYRAVLINYPNKQEKADLLRLENKEALPLGG